MAPERDEPDDARPRSSLWREFRKTLYSVAIGVGLFIASYLLLDGEPLSDQERAELFQYTTTVPVFLDVCAERGLGDPTILRKASVRATAFLQDARDRSAVGLIVVPPGSTLSAELERRLPELVDVIHRALGESGMSAVQWQRECTQHLADAESADTTWARLERQFPHQLSKLGLSRPR
jgi:hypothetical protein